MQTIYLGRYGKSNIYKIGQTGQIIVERERQIMGYAIKHDYIYADKYRTIACVSYDITKAQAEYIESFVRLQFEKNGLKIFGNDHINSKQGKEAMIKAFNMLVMIAYNNIVNDTIKIF